MSRFRSIAKAVSVAVFAAILVAAGAVVLPAYGVLMVVWFHVPRTDVLTTVAPIALFCVASGIFLARVGWRLGRSL